MRRSLALAILLISASSTTSRAVDAPATAPDYASQVAPILKKYCAGCHNDGDREGEFSLESYASLRKGTPHGPALKPGDAGASRIIRQLTGAGKPSMPPKGEPRPDASEVALLRAWIDAGARGPAEGGPVDRLALSVPAIPSRAKIKPVTALDVSRDGKWLAIGRYATVTLVRAEDGPVDEATPGRVLDDFPGKVTAVHFRGEGEGSRLVTASGVAGLGGVAAIWDVEDGSLIRRFPGHRDLLYDAELSPDGRILATCGYDKAILLWDADAGTLLRTLEGHNGAVYDVAFSPDGRALVSASADDTCKVWRVADGTRLDTLPQPLKEEYACAFTPDGRSIVAAGADNTIRVWDFVSRDAPRINPLVRARFAHESPIVRLAFTPDGTRLVTLAEDRTVKAWDATDYTELRLWDDQPDVATALAISGDGSSFRVGRLDGSLARYPLPRARPTGEPASRTDPGPVGVAVPPRVVDVEAVPMPSKEAEPNDDPARANALVVPAAVRGTIAGRAVGVADIDVYRFRAKAGEPWVVEVDAARSGSKLDSFVEVLDGEGNRIPRVLLQAVRSSYFTFRGKDDSTIDDFRLFNWEEMRLNEYLYANGEVVRLWLYPRGPDSGFQVYPGQGKRWGAFDTTPLAHAMGEPCYVVEPHPPGTALIPNGLPVFPLYYDNDDDAHRELGDDSRLAFTAPADGEYLVRIKDVRSQEGPNFAYTMTIRPSRPDFLVMPGTPKLAVGPGDAREFKLTAKRIDGYDGPIRVDFAGMPPGFSITTPLVIEPGQVEALGVVAAADDAPTPSPEQVRAIAATATATIDGREAAHPFKPFEELKRAETPKLRVRVEAAGSEPGPPEFEIRPGQTITLKVRLVRNGFAGQVPFGKEGAGRNLPFGVYVDNLGLNGLLILEGQDERTFFITADRSVPQSRVFHLNTAAAGGHSSLPVVLHVR